MARERPLAACRACRPAHARVLARRQGDRVGQVGHLGQHQELALARVAIAVEPGPVDDARLDLVGGRRKAAGAVGLEEHPDLGKEGALLATARAAEALESGLEADPGGGAGFARWPAGQARRRRKLAGAGNSPREILR